MSKARLICPRCKKKRVLYGSEAGFMCLDCTRAEAKLRGDLIDNAERFLDAMAK